MTIIESTPSTPAITSSDTGVERIVRSEQEIQVAGLGRFLQDWLRRLRGGDNEQGPEQNQAPTLQQQLDAMLKGNPFNTAPLIMTYFPSFVKNGSIYYPFSDGPVSLQKFLNLLMDNNNIYPGYEIYIRLDTEAEYEQVRQYINNLNEWMDLKIEVLIGDQYFPDEPPQPPGDNNTDKI